MVGVKSTVGYSSTAKVLHWLAALCVIAAWPLGNFIDDFPKTVEPTAIYAHMTFGLTVLALVFIRLGWRYGHPPPELLPSRYSPWAERAAVGAHWLLYLLMFALPISGIVFQFARGKAVPVFGLFDIASPWARDRVFAHQVGEIHELLANTLLILAALHAFAALAHHYILKDETLRRMLPVQR
ncbi:cytochrome b561 [Enhydrobacter aerosaccus]|uniref:Cytochrome b561 n=1 Tax=Enhydrobacter aerosaccus TaxID=225324 RepID=A0A1T4SRK2_9HYPH|nr:cytochrome b [Enhydrobacter aerosaccus]SKA30786.1 cytochrome b561 [Enhydrobacter aerosaccus]